MTALDMYFAFFISNSSRLNCTRYYTIFLLICKQFRKDPWILFRKGCIIEIVACHIYRKDSIMAEIGTVIRISGNLVQLEIPRSKACGGCRACVPLNGRETMTTYAINACGAEVGDRVEIEPGESRPLFSSLLLYGLPLAVFLGLIFLGSLFASEAVTVGLALGGMLLTYLILYFLSHKMNTERYTHRAVRILPR